MPLVKTDETHRKSCDPFKPFKQSSRVSFASLAMQFPQMNSSKICDTLNVKHENVSSPPSDLQLKPIVMRCFLFKAVSACGDTLNLTPFLVENLSTDAVKVGAAVTADEMTDGCHLVEWTPEPFVLSRQGGIGR